MTPGDVVIAMFPGAHLTKVRPAVVLSTELYQRSRPDVLIGAVTTRRPDPLCPTDYELVSWKQAGLHAPSIFRLYIVTLLQTDVRVVGRLTEADWFQIRQRVEIGLIAV